MKSKKTLFSIITPCYNTGRFLEACIQSVLAQNYPHVEHIIQDGNSTDTTKKILKKYSKTKYRNRVKWISEPDTGQVDGLDKALKRARGDILLVLNADDLLMPYACSWAIAQFDLFPSMAVIYGDVFIINEKGNILKIGKGEEYDFYKLFCVELVPPAQAAFIQRKYFEEVGLYTDISLDTCPDFEMWVRIGRKFQMKYIPGIISKYRAYPHDDSKKPRTAERFFTAKKRVIDKIINDPKTPLKIKRLRKRAYQGLSFWAAHEAIDLNNYYQSILFWLKFLYINPSKRAFKYIWNVFKDSPLMFINTIIQILGKETKIIIMNLKKSITY